MSRIIIRTRNGDFPAEIDDSDISNTIWLSAPISVETNMLGGMCYAELPLDAVIPKEGRVTQMEIGDIAYWPAPGAICFFYGPTPLSGEDGKPVAPFPMVRIGRMIGDCSKMEEAGDRQRLTIMSTF